MRETFRKAFKQNKALVLCIVLLVLTVAASIITKISQKQLEADIVIPTMVCDRYFYPLDFAHIEGQKSEIPLTFVKEGTPLPDLKLNTAYPVFQNNGATMYLYEDNYLMVTDTYEEFAGTAGVIAGEGTVFDENTSLPVQENVLFLKSPDIDAYVSLVPIQLEGEVTDTIPQYALFFLRDERLEIYEYYRGRLKYRVRYVTDKTFVLCGEEKCTFYEWKARMRHEEVSVQNPQEPEETRFYFFDMGDQFTTEGELIFRRTSESRIALENENKLYDVHQIPLYYEDMDAILLPGVFGLVQPWAHKMNSLPEMTNLVRDTYVVYFQKEDWFVPMKDAFLYDGGTRYIMLNQAELIVGGESVALAPLSLITIEDEAKFSVYEYDSKEFKMYYVAGGKPTVRLGNGVDLLPFQKKIEQSGGKGDLLIADPSLLPLLQ